jgi:hypothetical protein
LELRIFQNFRFFPQKESFNMLSLPKALTGAAVVAALAASSAAHAYTNPPFSAPGIANPGAPAFVSGVQSANVDDIDFQWNANADGHHDGAYVLSINESAQNVGVFNFPSGAYTVGNESVEVTAYFDSKGNLITNNQYLKNTYEVEGSLNASSSPNFGTAPGGYKWTAQPANTVLFSANLTSVGVDSAHDALGFNTDNFSGWANQKQFTGGSTSESLWLYALINTGNLYCVLPRPGSNCNNNPNQTGALPYSTTNTAWNNFLTELKNHSGVKDATFYGIGAIATVPLPAGLLLFGSGLAALGGAFRRRRSPELGSAVAA